MLLKVLAAVLVWGNLCAAERIIALSPAINETLYALGAGDQIIANTEYCNYPMEAKNKPKVGGYFSPSLEKILSLSPTMVILQENNAPLAAKIEKMGIKTRIIKIDTYPSIRESIFTMGQIVGKEKRAEAIVSELDHKLRVLRGIVRNQKILMVFGHNTDLSKSIYVSGQNLYFDDLIRESGNVNALQSSRKGQPVLNLENIIALNPDIIILLAPNTKERGLTKEALIAPWRHLPINAAKRGKIYVEDQPYSSNPSQRLGLFLDDMRGYLLDAARR
ncbi:MAG: helical backbone metal receptor [Sulfuricurvum sp.]|uniref:ABC transporter substrate-binding protein n=1 Tax=Sulfuricurvum sp. TaxID=2025608 RepID=UPI0027322D98|nr:helical backbone metal receptor [Sulfuricurvum sp.]MDP3292903.1 helical backbone metal receptor [Sulfuricurvum sp.]